MEKSLDFFIGFCELRGVKVCESLNLTVLIFLGFVRACLLKYDPVFKIQWVQV